MPIQCPQWRASLGYPPFTVFEHRHLRCSRSGATVEIDTNARRVIVKGPRGELTRDFRHIKISLTKLGANRVRADMWFGNRKELACVRSLCSHIENMIVGVTTGYAYRMRFAYAHFPINVQISGDSNIVEIRNFLGERRVRRIKALKGVKVALTSNKDELEVSGNGIEECGMTAALIHQACMVRNKDIRKFLDGIYVSEKGPIGALKPI